MTRVQRRLLERTPTGTSCTPGGLTKHGTSINRHERTRAQDEADGHRGSVGFCLRSEVRTDRQWISPRWRLVSRASGRSTRGHESRSLGTRAARERRSGREGEVGGQKHAATKSLTSGSSHVKANAEARHAGPSEAIEQPTADRSGSRYADGLTADRSCLPAVESEIQVQGSSRG